MAFVAVIKFVYTQPLTETALAEALNIEADLSLSALDVLHWPGIPHCCLSYLLADSVKNPDEVHQ